MRYKKKAIYDAAADAITKNNLFFVEDIVAFIPCDKTTFYRMFPPDCNESNTLKAMLDDNKVRTKSGIRRKLYGSQKAAELLALYRLVCTPEERKLLNQQYIEMTGKDGADLHKEITVEVIDRREDVDKGDEEGGGDGQG